MTTDTIDAPDAPNAPAAKAAAPTPPRRFFRMIAARYRPESAPHARGAVLLGSTWLQGASGPVMFARRLLILPMGDAFSTCDGAEIAKHVDREHPLWVMTHHDGHEIDATARALLEAAGLDIPTKPEPTGALATVNLMTYAKEDAQ